VPGRDGARPGDRLWITGPVGAAMLAFAALRDGTAGVDTSAFRRPMPRLAKGIALAPQVGAMMDVSDGLLIDAQRMALASGVTLAIESAAVPCPESIRQDLRHDAMTWGDDYELLFTLPSDQTPACLAYAIGRAEEFIGNSVLVDGAPPKGRLGYWHD
jgi:thiamine-monophosphate kinase